MTPDECRTALRGNLDQSLDLVTKLYECLMTERHALEQRDTVALETAALQKRELVERLDDLDRARNVIGKDCGFSPSAQLLGELSHWCQDGSLPERWQEFLHIAETCSDLNNCIGAIIRVRQLQVQDALGLLRGQVENSSTYGPTGQDGRNLGSRALAQA